MPSLQSEIRSNPFLWAKLQGMAPHFKECRRVVEIGPGCGEFLYLLKQQGVEGLGVDLEERHISACRDRGVKAVKKDALAFLASAKPGSFDGFFSSNVVEHLPSKKVSRLLDLACAKLKPGGILGLMTGNTQCLAWVSHIFLMELSHVRPYPLVLLEEMVKARGLNIVESGQDERGRSQGWPRRGFRFLKTKLIGPFFGPPEVYLIARKPVGRR
jgi:predicted TPR repeat methyltransferase